MSESKTEIQQGTISGGAIGVQVIHNHNYPAGAPPAQPATKAGAPVGRSGGRMSVEDALRKAIVDTLGDYSSRRPLYFGAFEALSQQFPKDDVPANQYGKDLQALRMPGREAVLRAFLTNAQRMAVDGALSTAAEAIAAARVVLCTPKTAPHNADEPAEVAVDSAERAACLTRLVAWLAPKLSAPLLSALDDTGTQSAEVVARALCELPTLDALHALYTAARRLESAPALAQLTHLATRLIPITIDWALVKAAIEQRRSGIELAFHTESIVELVMAGADERHAHLVPTAAGVHRRGKSSLQAGWMSKRLMVEHDTSGRSATELRKLTVHHLAHMHGIDETDAREDWAVAVETELDHRIAYPEKDQPPYYLIIDHEQIWQNRAVMCDPNDGLPSLRLVYQLPVDGAQRRVEYRIRKLVDALLRLQPKDTQ